MRAAMEGRTRNELVHLAVGFVDRRKCFSWAMGRKILRVDSGQIVEISTEVRLIDYVAATRGAKSG